MVPLTRLSFLLVVTKRTAIDPGPSPQGMAPVRHGLTVPIVRRSCGGSVETQGRTAGDGELRGMITLAAHELLDTFGYLLVPICLLLLGVGLPCAAVGLVHRLERRELPA